MGSRDGNQRGKHQKIEMAEEERRRQIERNDACNIDTIEIYLFVNRIMRFKVNIYTFEIGLKVLWQLMA